MIKQVEWKMFSPELSWIRILAWKIPT